MATDDNTPILIGTGQQTWTTTDISRSPVDALYAASNAALGDVNCKNLTKAVDALGLIRFIADTTPEAGALFPRNPGQQLMRRLGIADATVYQGIIGGNSPQYLVNHFADKLARGEHTAVLIAGAELLATFFAALRSGEDLSHWGGSAEQAPPTIGQDRPGHNATELAHGLYEPINTYPIFENSLQHHLKATQREHLAHIAELCSAMSRVASNNPHAWRQDFKSAEQISTVAKNNRLIGYPYTRAMNPILEVDMAAAVVMTTVGTARKLGIDQTQWVYLRGGADVNDIWYVSERPSLHTSPAISAAWRLLSSESGISLDEIAKFDIYSCFPSAVQIACNAIGLPHLDPRGITVTGGLPYFGGPGNNYSLHAIAEMVVKLRDCGAGHGLVTANGLYLTKHSLGLYSTEPPHYNWLAVQTDALQQTIDDAPRLRIATTPTGNATIESFTVSFGRDGPKKGIVIAKNTAGERVVANTGVDEKTLKQLITHDPIGRQGYISVHDGNNLLEF